VWLTEAELASKLQEAESVYGSVVESSQERSSRLEETLFVSENFQQAIGDVMTTVRAVQDNLMSQDAPGADPATLQEQLKELQVRVRTISVINLLCTTT